MQKLESKIIVNLGDSIFGNFRPPVDISSFLAEKTDATVFNCGFGGTRMCYEDSPRDALSGYRLAEAIATRKWILQDNALSPNVQWKNKKDYFFDTLALLKSIDFSKVDIITIAYGTNDFGAGCPVTNPDDSYDTHSFSGALQHSIEALRSAYPHAKIVLCTPIWRCWRDDEQTVIDTAQSKIIGGQKLLQFVEQVKNIAAKHSLLCIDNYNHCGICLDTQHLCFNGKDGTHPNEIGRHMIADYMANILLHN